MSTAIVLVDYDNVRPNRRESTADDTEGNLQNISDSLAAMVRAVAPKPVSEIELRLYGGWMTEGGAFTQRADWAARRLYAARGIRHGVRVMPKLVLSVAQQHSVVLRGSLRNSGGRPTQKMVDSMICVDLVYFSRVSTSTIVVACDDDDIVPALVVAGVDAVGGLCVLRNRMPNAAVNDDHLQRCCVRIELLPEPLRRQ